MAQRKGNLHVKERSSEERDQENLDFVTAASCSEFPQPQGIYLAEGTGKVRLNWHQHLQPVREPKSVEKGPLPRQGNVLCGDFQWE